MSDDGSWADRALDHAKYGIVAGKVAMNALGAPNEAVLQQQYLGVPADPPAQITAQVQEDWLGDQLGEQSMNPDVGPPPGGGL